MSTKILIPTDFSECATNALDYAIYLGEQLSAELLIYHTYIWVDSAFINKKDLDDENRRREQVSVELLEKTVEYVKTKNSSIKCRSILSVGAEVESILNTIKEENIDYVVMGTHGASGVREFIVGSYAADVIENADCPVFVIPEAAGSARINKIVCASALHQTEILAAYHVNAIADKLNAEMIILNINTNRDRQLEDFDFFSQSLSRINASPVKYELIQSPEILSEIEKYLNINQADLLVLMGRASGLFSKLLQRNLKRKLAFHTHYPLLSFPEGKYSHEMIEAIEAGQMYKKLQR